MKTLKDIVNYETAPLKQWEPVIGEAPSAGKQKEDRLTHGAVARELWSLDARKITGIISDEARQELAIAEQNDRAAAITHLTLPGAFAMAAQHNVETALKAGRIGAEKIRVTTDADSIHPHSQDAVVLNMILGCLATPEDHSNIHSILMFAAQLLNAEGSLVIVRPNPEAGKTRNLYTPDSFLKEALDKAGFVMGRTKAVSDALDEKLETAPFLMNVCELRCNV